MVYEYPSAAGVFKIEHLFSGRTKDKKWVATLNDETVAHGDSPEGALAALLNGPWGKTLSVRLPGSLTGWHEARR